MLQNILAILSGWLLSYVLTVSGQLPDKPEEVGYMARSDAKSNVIKLVPWIYIPYPGNSFTGLSEIPHGVTYSTQVTCSQFYKKYTVGLKTTSQLLGYYHIM